MLTISIAWRFFTSKKRQTALIVFGFAIGIAVNIFIGSLIQSLQVTLLDDTIGRQPHISVLPATNTTELDDWPGIKSVIDSHPEVVKYAESIEGRIFILGEEEPDVAFLRGMPLERANSIYRFYDNFTGNAPTDDEVIVGSLLAEELDLSVGDRLELTRDPRIQGIGRNVTVSGIFDIGVAELNRQWVLMPMVGATAILNSSITSVGIQIRDPFMADSVASELEAEIGDAATVLNWKEQNQQLLSGLQAQSSSTNLIQTFVLLSVVIAIASILSITVLQKSRQLGILKAMGMTDRRAAQIFFFQGFLFGLFGSLLGAGIAEFLIFGFTTFATTTFTISLDIAFVGSTMAISVLSSMAAALLPARSSSRMEIIEVIRNN